MDLQDIIVAKHGLPLVERGRCGNTDRAGATPAMIDNVRSRVSLDDGTESIDNKEQWQVVVQPPAEYNDSARAAAERLFSGLHGVSLSVEIESDGANVALKIVVDDRETAEMVGRHVRAELNADAKVERATLPVSRDDPLASAEFRYKRDAIFPLATDRTDDREIGPLHHVLDTMSAEECRGTYQIVAEPIESEDWTARMSRDVPESIPSDRDEQGDYVRAGAVMVPVLGLSVLLSPWPLGTSLIVALGLLIAASVGEGVRAPQRRTGEELAHEHLEKTKAAHSARSTQAKKAETTAEAITEMARSPGWRLSARLTVAAETATASVRYRDRLVTQIKRAYASDVTGQELTVTTESGPDFLERVENRQLKRKPIERVRRLLAHGTRRELCGGTAVLGSLGYFAGRDGGGGDSREFASESNERVSMAVPDAAPTYTRSPAITDGGTTAESAFHVDPDETVTREHPEYGEVEVKIIEFRPDKDNDDVYAGEFCREWVESSEHDSLIWVGYSEGDGQIREIGVPITQLRRPSFIAGASGAGKSTLAEIIALQHIEGGRGCAIIDPHDDFVDELLTKIPEHRRDDVILIDPADLESEFTHTINFLDVEVDPDHPDYDEAVNDAIADAIGVISQGASNVGDRMEDVLYGVTRGMITSEKDYTFLDMRDVLRYEVKREQFAIQMRQEGHKYLAQFANDLTEMSNNELAPVNRLLNQWVLSETAREIIRHTETSINFREAIDEDKIILVRNDLSKDIQRLFATAIFSKIWRAARQRPRDERPLYPVIMDEIDDVHTPEMDLGSKLGNARKFGIGLTLMTQKPKELSDIEEDIKTNCKLFVSFACPSDKQARPVSKIFDCDRSRISQLGDYRSLVQLDIDGDRKGPFTTEMLAPIPSRMTDDEVEQEISIPSRRTYGIRRDRVDGPKVEDDEDEDENESAINRFLRAAADAADDGKIENGHHFTFIHEGTARETLRINPSRTIKALDLDEDDIETVIEEVTDASRELEDDDSSYVTNHRQPTPGCSRCTGVDLTRVEGVSPESFKTQ